MMGSSIPYRSHWPKVLVDSSGRIVGQHHDGGSSISRKPAYRGRAPLHPPRHYCFKEKYFPHGSQEFQSLLSQYQARALAQPGLECVGVHIPAPTEQQALAQLAQGTEPTDPPRGAEEEGRQEGRGTSAAPDAAETGQTESQGAAGPPSQGGTPIGPATCPPFQQKCPCELVTQVCCPCKELMERELARLAGPCPGTSPEHGAESVGTSPIPAEEDLQVSPPQQEVSTSPEAPEDLETSPHTPIDDLATSPEPPENLETSPEPPDALESSPTGQVEDLEMSPEPPEDLETSPEPPENLETSPAVQVENLEASPEAGENSELLPNEPTENLETTTPEPAGSLELSPEPVESVEPSPEPVESLEPSPEPAEVVEQLPEPVENPETAPEEPEN